MRLLVVGLVGTGVEVVCVVGVVLRMIFDLVCTNLFVLMRMMMVRSMVMKFVVGKNNDVLFCGISVIYIMDVSEGSPRKSLRMLVLVRLLSCSFSSSHNVVRIDVEDSG